jgi:hypothetical protein
MAYGFRERGTSGYYHTRSKTGFLSERYNKVRWIDNEMKASKLSFDNPNPSRRKQLVSLDTYAHNWGILVPCQSGFIWEQQTGGVACYHIQVEGVYIPLREPNDYLASLRIANYNSKSTTTIWKKIKETMNQWEGFRWEEVDNPSPSKFPNNQEGMQWIKITNWHSGKGMQLIGETVILIYPNCD